MLAPAGPAVTMEPLCPSCTVLSVYAVGAASDTTRPSPATAGASRRPSRPAKTSPSAATRPPTRTSHFSQGR
ncbi:hypothetical protein LV779_38420 [Streptomyces thinghirensis]|nr:hypothetical protein [Streptomyces thinghirensis]